MSSPAAEPKAKRTHARRSCELCKVRKTRCELPDVDIASSSTPLPHEKACHRCQVLALPCVVDDTAKRPRPKKKDARGSITPTDKPMPRKKRVKREQTTATPGEEDAAPQPEPSHSDNDPLDVLHGFRLRESEGSGDVMPPFGSGAPMESPQSQSIKLHGRPLELICAMLSVAYGKKGAITRGLESGTDVDVYKLAHPELRRKLGYSVAQLQTLHPWLEPLDVLFSDNSAYTDLSYKLLLLAVVYIATVSLPTDPDCIEFRSASAPLIGVLRDDVMLQLPKKVHAAQALTLLSVHSPLGVIPLQNSNPRALAVARGQATSAQAILTVLDYPTMIHNVTAYDPASAGFDVDEVWTWLSVCADEAQMAMEAEEIVRPPSLNEARNLTEKYMAPERLKLWHDARHIGRLAVCDRICRMGTVHDGYASMRGTLDIAARDPHFDIVGSINQQLQYITGRLEETDRRHDSIINILRGSSNRVETGWLSYRGLRKRFEINVMHVVGLRIIMAAAFIPGGSLAFTGLPMALSTTQKPRYALARANNPPDIITIMMSPDGPIKRAIWHWGSIRGELCKDILSLFLDVAQSALPPSAPGAHAVIVPMHECCSIAVESCKVLMEFQRSSIVVLQRGGEATNFIVPLWYDVLRQVCETTAKIGQLSRSTTEDRAQQRFESIPIGCGKLLDSMRRMAHDYLRGVEGGEREEGIPPMGQHLEPLPSLEHLLPPSAHSSLVHSSPLETPHDMSQAYPTGQLAQPPQGHYMDGSDRWMAQNGMPSGSAPQMSNMPAQNNGGAPPNGHWAPDPTPLDLLLSQMFNYPNPYASQHQGPGPPQPPKSSESHEGMENGWSQQVSEGHHR